MNRLDDHHQELLAAWKRMEQIWSNARLQWKDQVRADFEQQHWVPLESQVHDYSRALESMAKGIRGLSRG